MATQTIEFVAPVGITATAKLFAIGSDVQVDTASATEATNRGGTYTASYTDVAAGTYKLNVENAAGRAVATWQVVLTLTTATFYAVEAATSAAIEAIKATTDQFVFGNPNEVNANVVSGAVGGDATEANQQLILNLLAAGATISTPVPNASTLQLINGDSYNGTAGSLLSWTVAKDYSAATSVKLVITSATDLDTIYKTQAAVVASATSVTVDLDVDFGDELTFAGCPLTAELAFALVADWAGDEETIARGRCYVYDRGEPV